jgi:flagellum-specific ATP synthase
VLASVSRLVGEVTTPAVRGAGDEGRRLMAAYKDKEDLIAIGAYQSGTDPLTDAAIAARTPIEGFLRQRVDDRTSAEDAEQGLLACAAYAELVGVPDQAAMASPVPMPAEAPGTPLASAIPPLNLPT